MLDLSTVGLAVRLRLQRMACVVALSFAVLTRNLRAQEHQHQPEHADSSMKPMKHDSVPPILQDMGSMQSVPMLSRPFGIPMSRMGSGTAWLPDASPMRAYHFMPDGWMLMVHGDVDLYYDHQGTVRGDDQIGSTNWAMIMAMHRLGQGMLHLHAMLSAEPFTVGGRG